MNREVETGRTPELERLEIEIETLQYQLRLSRDDIERLEAEGAELRQEKIDLRGEIDKLKGSAEELHMDDANQAWTYESVFESENTYFFFGWL